MRRLVPTLLLALLATAACGDGETGNDGLASLPDDAFDAAVSTDAGVLLEYSLSAGECPSCAWSVVLDAEGTGMFATVDATVAIDHDAADLLALIDELRPPDLVTGADDCGREVDGNAPTLTVDGIGFFDRCYGRWDSDHPLLVHLEAIRAASAS